MIISIHTEKKAFDKIYHLFMMKIISKLGRQGNTLNLIKGIRHLCSSYSAAGSTLQIKSKAHLTYILQVNKLSFKRLSNSFTAIQLDGSTVITQVSY